MSVPSVSVCFGKDCKVTGTPSGYKPAEFTSAASKESVNSMVGVAGWMLLLQGCFRYRFVCLDEWRSDLV